MSISDSIIGHCGWHFPVLPSSEAHDYHHSSGYIDNLGTLGLMDAYFKTTTHYDESFQAKVDKTYGLNGDYAVDKIFAKAETPPPGGADEEAPKSLKVVEE